MVCTSASCHARAGQTSWPDTGPCNLQVLEGILPKEVPLGAPPPDKKLLEHQFVFACIWAFGGCLSADKVVDYRLQFSRWWQGEFKTVTFPPEVGRPGGAGAGRPSTPRVASACFTAAHSCSHCPLPKLQGTVFDYAVHQDGENVCMVHWSTRVPQFTYQPGMWCSGMSAGVLLCRPVEQLEKLPPPPVRPQTTLPRCLCPPWRPRACRTCWTCWSPADTTSCWWGLPAPARRR